MVIFKSYVSLPEGKQHQAEPFWIHPLHQANRPTLFWLSFSRIHCDDSTTLVWRRQLRQQNGDAGGEGWDLTANGGCSTWMWCAYIDNRYIYIYKNAFYVTTKETFPTNSKCESCECVFPAGGTLACSVYSRCWQCWRISFVIYNN